jgi:hypothetical protein
MRYQKWVLVNLIHEGPSSKIIDGIQINRNDFEILND